MYNKLSMGFKQVGVYIHSLRSLVDREAGFVMIVDMKIIKKLVVSMKFPKVTNKDYVNSVY